MVKLGNIAQLNMIFTNKQPPEEILSILKEASIPLEVVEANETNFENE
jgi:DeoR family glycerol-3-phosphate regulon repressor